MAQKETWRLASDEEIPERFTDPACDEFMCICSNGFEGDLSIGSAFMHKPARFPKCFPAGPDGNAACTNLIVRKVA